MKSYRNYSHIALSSCSHKFNIKPFNQIKIGDIISSPQDFGLYYIFGKYAEEEIVEKDDKSGKIAKLQEYIKGEKIDSLDKFRKEMKINEKMYNHEINGRAVKFDKLKIKFIGCGPYGGILRTRKKRSA